MSTTLDQLISDRDDILTELRRLIKTPVTEGSGAFRSATEQKISALEKQLAAINKMINSISGQLPLKVKGLDE